VPIQGQAGVLCNNPKNKTMYLPNIITALIKAQDSFDSLAYANCFSETAIVVDEGNTYKGRTEIMNWIDRANQQYRAKMKPIEFSETENTLKAEISGDFPGSPAVLSYHFSFTDALIQSLKISG
jgi:hypothetical protein